jgi:dTDP-glucose 4,6-dehydratase
MRKILITGAAGFIGSHLSEYLFEIYNNTKFILYDKITYAANKKYLHKIIRSKSVKFVKGDLLDFKLLQKNLKNVDLAINVAAESHVDNSFGNSLLFTKTNTLGTHYFLEACRKENVKKIIHVSTDEVYGENQGKPFNEKQNLNPTNPYSASKAGADMLVNSYIHSYKMPIITIRANNIYGTRQYPEKLISKSIHSFIKKKKMTLHGKGENFRYYLSVHDFCSGVNLIIKKGKNREIYNIASKKFYKVKNVIKIICNYFKINLMESIVYVKDRPFNDKIYKINCQKLVNLGWQPKKNLEKEIPNICEWYIKNNKLF